MILSTDLDIKKELETLQKITPETLKFSIFFSTFHKVQDQERSGTGDIDYTQTLVNIMNQKFPISCYMRGITTEKACFDFIEQHKANATPILHIMLNAPNVGFGFSEAGLEAFKHNNGKIVMTAVEFKKYPSETSYKSDMLKFLKYADEIIFLDEHDKNDAYKMALMEFQKSHSISKDGIATPGYMKAREKLVKIFNARILPVPATISVDLLPIHERGHNIGCFGMLRDGKGLSHVLELAKILGWMQQQHADDLPFLKDMKILIIGSAIDSHKLLSLMSKVYKHNLKEIEECGEDLEKLKDLLARFIKSEQEGTLTTSLPIEIHVDVKEEELAIHFNRCTYFIQANYRGASLRFSSMSSLLAQGFCIYSHCSDITPLTVLRKSIYQEAVHLINERHYSENNQNYANAVLKDIMECESERIKTADPRLTKIERRSLAAKRLYEQELSPSKILDELTTLYRKLGFARKETDPAKIQSLKIAAKYFKRWNKEIAIRSAFKLVRDKTKIDIKSQSKASFAALRKRFLEVETQNICKEVQELVLKSRTTQEINGVKVTSLLTPLETYFVEIMLNAHWEARHVTDKPVLDKIINAEGALLSIEQRFRYSCEAAIVANTPDQQGMRDHIFASIGVGKNIQSPHFVSAKKGVAVFDLNKIAAENPESLKGLWSSDHWPSYLVKGVRSEYTIFGVNFKVEHRQSAATDPTAPPVHDKILSYTLSDKESYTQVVKFGDELFLHPKIQLGLALLTVEMMRYLGISAYTKILAAIQKVKDSPCDSEYELNQLFRLMRIRHHPGLTEIHMPRRWQITDVPGISSVTKYDPSMSAKEINDYAKEHGLASRISTLSKFLGKECQDVFETIEQAIILLLTETCIDNTAMKKLMLELNNCGMLTYRIRIHELSLNLLEAALLVGKLALLEFMLGLEIQSEDLKTLIEDFKQDGLFVALIKVANLFSNPEELEKRFISKLGLAKKILVPKPEYYKDILQLALKGSLTDRDNFFYPKKIIGKDLIAHACLSYKVTQRILQTLLENYQGDLAALSICWPVLSENVELVQIMMQKVNLYEPYNSSQHDIPGITSISIPDGFNALQIACLKNSKPEMVAFLLQQKFSMKPFKASKESRTSSFYAALDGYTPLMIASNKRSIPIMQLFYKSNCDIDYVNDSHESIFTISADMEIAIDHCLQEDGREKKLRELAKFLVQETEGYDKEPDKNSIALCSTKNILRSLILYLIKFEKYNTSKLQELLLFLHQNKLLNYKVQFGERNAATYFGKGESIYYLTVMNAALLGGNIEAFEYLVSLKPKINTEKFIIYQEKNSSQCSSHHSILSVALKRNTISYLKNIFQSDLKPISLEQRLQKIIQANTNSLYLDTAELKPRNAVQTMQAVRLVLDLISEPDSKHSDEILKTIKNIQIEANDVQAACVTCKQKPELILKILSLYFQSKKTQKSDSLKKVSKDSADKARISGFLWASAAPQTMKAKTSESEDSLFHWGIQTGSVAVVHALIEFGFDPHNLWTHDSHDLTAAKPYPVETPEGLNALQILCLTGNDSDAAMVEYLIKQNLSRNPVTITWKGTDMFQYSLLMLAARNGSKAIMKTLLLANEDMHYSAAHDTAFTIPQSSIWQGIDDYLIETKKDSLFRDVSQFIATTQTPDLKSDKEGYLIKLTPTESFTKTILKSFINYLLVCETPDMRCVPLLLDFLHQEKLLNAPIKFENANFTVNNAAVLAFSLDPLKHLLKSGWISHNETFLNLHREQGKSYSILSVAAARSNTETLQSLIFDKLGLAPGRLKDRDPKTAFEAINLLLSHKDTDKTAATSSGIKSVFKIGPRDIGAACVIFKADTSAILRLLSEYQEVLPDEPDRLSLCWGAHIRNLEVMKTMVKMGVPINEMLNKSQSFTDGPAYMLEMNKYEPDRYAYRYRNPLIAPASRRILVSDWNALRIVCRFGNDADIAIVDFLIEEMSSRGLAKDPQALDLAKKSDSKLIQEKLKLWCKDLVPAEDWEQTLLSASCSVATSTGFCWLTGKD